MHHSQIRGGMKSVSIMNRYRNIIPRRRTATKLHAYDVSMDYITMYSLFICHQSTTCLNNIVLPSIDEQQRIVVDFAIAASQLKDMHGLDPLFFKLAHMHQSDLIARLIEYVHELDAIDGNIHAMIDLVNNLPSNLNDVKSA